MKTLHRLVAVASAAFFIAGSALAQNSGTVSNHAFALGKGPGTTGYTSLLCASAQLAVGQSAADPICKTITGDVTLTAAGVTAIGTAKVVQAMIALNAIDNTRLAQMANGAIKCRTTAGTGNPEDCTGAQIRTILALVIGTNVEAWDADLDCIAALSGTGILRRTGAGTCSNGTAVTNSELAAAAAFTLKGNATGSSAIPTDIDVTALTLKASPVSTDTVLIQDSAASNAFKKTTVGALASAGSVASIAGNTGAFALSHGITNSGNDIQLSLTNATLQASPTSPTGTTSTVGVMMGLGGVCKLTPVYSGRVKLEFIGAVRSSAVSSLTLKIAFGAGTAPINGAAATGTQVAANLSVDEPMASFNIPFINGGIITGLTPGTAYWFDINLASASASNTASALGISCNAMEF